MNHYKNIQDLPLILVGTQGILKKRKEFFGFYFYIF